MPPLTRTQSTKSIANIENDYPSNTDSSKSSLAPVAPTSNPNGASSSFLEKNATSTERSVLSDLSNNQSRRSKIVSAF